MKYPEIAKRFRTILSLRNMKQQELANRAGVNKSFISHYVNGTHCPSNITAQQLADVLDVNPLWLMDLDDTMERKIPIANLSDEEVSFLRAFRNANPVLRNAARSVLESGAQSSSAPQSPTDTTQ